MAFFRGQRVVYVGGKANIPTGFRAAGDCIRLTKNEVYTVRDIAEFMGVGGIRVAEVHNNDQDFDSIFGGRQEPWYYQDHFRPVTDITDLIAITKEVFDKKPRTIEPDRFDRKVRV